MTAHAREGDRDRCLEAGMDGYISKPIHAKILYQALASFTRSNTAAQTMTRTSELGERATARRATSAGTAPVLAGTPAELFDKAALLALVGGREDRLRSIIQTFLEESSRLMAELREAIAGGDACTLQRPAHSLRGAAGVFGAPAVVDAAATLESLGQAGELSGASEAYHRLEREFHELKSALIAVLSPSRDDAPRS
jgi:HPt (histidine-containing phosphotransfer) domain-containing protein